MKDLIAIAVIIVIVGLAIGYIIKAKKSGAKCIGCPSGSSCPSAKNQNDSCGCGCCDCHTEDK